MLLEEFDKFKSSTHLGLAKIERKIENQPINDMESLKFMINTVKSEMAYFKNMFSIKKLA